MRKTRIVGKPLLDVGDTRCGGCQHLGWDLFNKRYCCEFNQNLKCDGQGSPKRLSICRKAEITSTANDEEVMYNPAGYLKVYTPQKRH